MNLFRRARKFLALAPAERALLAQSALRLTITAGGLRLFGFKRIYAWLDRVGPEPEPPQAMDEARRLADGVRRAARPLPYASCLPRSLALWWLLRRRGIPANIHVGVKKEKGDFRAHAWVEYQEMVLADSEDVRHRFAPFDHPLGKR